MVSETHLYVDQFAVSVKCQEGFVGNAVATKCNAHLGEYSLSGCRVEPVCVAPASVDGYVVTERKLQMSNFDVSVSCCSGYVGSNPKAIPCKSDKKAYSLQGCEKTTTSTSTTTTSTATTTTTTTTKVVCVAPASAEGYVVSETNLHVDQFAVSVKCQEGFVGNAVATKCNAHLGEYSLSGCRVEPVCVAPASVDGYVVTERKLQMSNFDVSVSCCSGYVGSNPKAIPCKSDKKAYSLQGCTLPIHCLAPEDAAGYILDEQNLLAHEFKVTATCAAGYVGRATVARCTADLRQYRLSGCRKRR